MNLPSGNEQRRNMELEERLSKLEGRHLRMLNRISYKLAKEKSSDDIKDAKQELYKFMRNPQNHQYNPLLVGVRSALYSKLDGSIKNTVFNNANLGLVISNGDVKTNYDLEGVQNFMTHGKIEYSCGFDAIDEPVFSRINIINSKILRYSENKNAIIGQNSTITGSDVLEHSKNDSCYIGNNSLISFSRINNHSTNQYTNVCRNSMITSSLIGNYSMNHNTLFGEDALINDRKNDLETIMNQYSRKKEPELAPL